MTLDRRWFEETMKQMVEAGSGEGIVQLNGLHGFAPVVWNEIGAQATPSNETKGRRPLALPICGHTRQFQGALRAAATELPDAGRGYFDAGRRGPPLACFSIHAKNSPYQSREFCGFRIQ